MFQIERQFPGIGWVVLHFKLRGDLVFKTTEEANAAIATLSGPSDTYRVMPADEMTLTGLAYQSGS